jgi:Ras-related protein Rab-7A
MVQDPETFPFMVVGNKSDMGADGRVVTTEQAQKFVKELGNEIEHIETSAKDNQNVAKAFTRLAQKALER